MNKLKKWIRKSLLADFFYQVKNYLYYRRHGVNRTHAWDKAKRTYKG